VWPDTRGDKPFQLVFEHLETVDLHTDVEVPLLVRRDWQPLLLHLLVDKVRRLFAAHLVHHGGVARVCEIIFDLDWLVVLVGVARAPRKVNEGRTDAVNRVCEEVV
jgi:hypothetical protein